MALNRNNILDREFHKFVESPSRPGEPAVEIVGSVSTTGGFTIPENADAITREVSGSQEIYKYREGGVSGTILKTITLTYTSSSLKDLVSAVET